MPFFVAKIKRKWIKLKNIFPEITEERGDKVLHKEEFNHMLELEGEKAYGIKKNWEEGG